MNDVVVIYHKSCSDGFLAGIIAKYYYTYYMTQHPDFKVHLEAVDVSSLESSIDQLPESRCLLSFDLAFTRVSLNKLYSKYPFFHVYDHHITTERECASDPRVTVDNSKSGAMLAWEHFYWAGNDTMMQFDGQNVIYFVPWIVKYIQDRDLWKFEQPYSKEVNTFLYDDMAKHFGEYERYYAYLTTIIWIEDAKKKGQLMLEHVDGLVKSIVEKTIFKNRIGICNSSIFKSEVGHAIMETGDADYAIIWNLDDDETCSLSLRSNDIVDVSRVAKELAGGGGHKNAAGCRMSLKDFLEKVLQ